MRANMLTLLIVLAEVLFRPSAAVARELPLKNVAESPVDLADVCTQGRVIAVADDEIDPAFTILILKDGPTRLTVSAPKRDFSELSATLDARVSVSGDFARQIWGSRQYSGPYLAAKAINVLEPPPNFFDAPALETGYLTPREIAALDKRRVDGVALATWGRRSVMLRTTDGNVINIHLHSDDVLPEPGTHLRAAGYPATDIYRMNLTNARWREENAPTGRVMRAESPEDIRASEILRDADGRPRLDSRFHGRLIRLCGLVRSMPPEAGPVRQLYLDTGDERIAVDVSTHPDAARGLAVGAKIEVTGRCLIRTGHWSDYDIFPRATGFLVIVNGPEGFRTLVAPAWWTPARLAMVLAILFGGLLAVLLWNRTLRRRVARRTRELVKSRLAQTRSEMRVEERTRLAVELHDALSQNLTGVALELRTAARAIADGRPPASEHLARAERVLGACRTELRNCLWDLRSDAMDRTSLDAVLRRALAPQLQGAKLSIRLQIARRRLPEDLLHALVRIVRELVANARRHGGAANLKVTGCIEGTDLLLRVRDDGSGFDPATAPGVADGHFGLQGIRERLAALDGSLDLESAPGVGTTASLKIPLGK